MKIQSTLDTGRSVTVTQPLPMPTKAMCKLADYYYIATLIQDAAVGESLEQQFGLSLAIECMNKVIATQERLAK